MMFAKKGVGEDKKTIIVADATKHRGNRRSKRRARRSRRRLGRLPAAKVDTIVATLPPMPAPVGDIMHEKHANAHGSDGGVST